MVSRKVRSCSPVQTFIDRPLRLIEGGSAMSATLRKTVPLRVASDRALWMVACTLRTDLADRPPRVPLRLPSMRSFT